MVQMTGSIDQLAELTGGTVSQRLRGPSVGEATSPGPSSQRRRTQRLRALQRSWDSDVESDVEPARGVSPRWTVPQWR